MLKLSPTDFVTLDQFSLRWRWTDSRYNLLPADRLAQIRPLNTSTATILDEMTCRVAYPIPSVAIGHGCSDDENTREWLARTLPDVDATILVSWCRDAAVQTSVGLFIAYWEDFCYPSSDDVVVVPLAGDWVLFYSHEETIYFWTLPLSSP